MKASAPAPLTAGQAARIFTGAPVPAGAHAILIQEDVGGQAHIGKLWRYSIATGTLEIIAQHDPARFTPGAPGFLTQDEESSGIIPMDDILGEGWFLMDVQAHYPQPGELVEGGQLLALRLSKDARKSK